MMTTNQVAPLWMAFASACFVACTSSPPPSNSQGVQCTAQLSITGSYTLNPNPPQPAGMTGCWGVGTWTFHAAALTDVNDCATRNPPITLTFLPSYSFKADWMDDPVNGGGSYVMSYLTDPAAHVMLMMNTNGGRCTGDLSLYSGDGTQVWELHPLLNPDNLTLAGNGQFSAYDSDQWTAQ